MEQKRDSRNGLMSLLSCSTCYEGHYVDITGRSVRGLANLGCEGEEIIVVLVAYWYIIPLLCSAFMTRLTIGYCLGWEFTGIGEGRSRVDQCQYQLERDIDVYPVQRTFSVLELVQIHI